MTIIRYIIFKITSFFLLVFFIIGCNDGLSRPVMIDKIQAIGSDKQITLSWPSVLNAEASSLQHPDEPSISAIINIFSILAQLD